MKNGKFGFGIIGCGIIVCSQLTDFILICGQFLNVREIVYFLDNMFRIDCGLVYNIKAI